MTSTRTVAIVGAGPAGFFASASLLAKKDLDIHVDMFERLATPWGLVRAGVAPDHPKIKSVTAVFEKTAEHPRFRFFGNVSIGADITAADLAERYDAVIYAHGAQTDRSLGIPGEELAGVVSASEFVGWYNGHPDFAEVSFDLNAERAVIVGNGNVALDVARMLAAPCDALAQTDMADHAISALRTSAIKEIVVLGRRGAVEAAFTTSEIDELSELADAQVIVDPAELVIENEDDLPLATRRNLAALRRYAEDPGPARTRRIILAFRRSPVELAGTDHVSQLTMAVNDLVADADGRISAVDSGAREQLEVGLVIRAVGYRGRELSGLPFDERTGTIPNTGGRIDGRANEYVAGWIKRGPSGIIGTNKKCAVETVAAVMLDLAAIPESRVSRPSPSENQQWIHASLPTVMNWQSWGNIDAAERMAGAPAGRPRVKICDHVALRAASELTELAEAAAQELAAQS